MKELIHQWFEQSTPFTGILACGVRHLDQTGATKSWADGFTDLALENALRCVADTYQVLQHHRVGPGRLRWVYEKAVFHCERRSDGVCLGIFTAREPEAFDAASVDRLFAEFREVGAGGVAPF